MNTAGTAEVIEAEHQVSKYSSSLLSNILYQSHYKSTFTKDHDAEGAERRSIAENMAMLQQWSISNSRAVQVRHVQQGNDICLPCGEDNKPLDPWNHSAPNNEEVVS